MMAQTAEVLSFLDRPWTLEDLISMPYDSESETDSSDAEAVGQDVVDLAHNQPLDVSLPSISAVMESTVDVRRRSTEAAGEQLANQTSKYGHG
jgi:hypothetical protein